MSMRLDEKRMTRNSFVSILAFAATLANAAPLPTPEDLKSYSVAERGLYCSTVLSSTLADAGKQKADQKFEALTLFVVGGPDVPTEVQQKVAKAVEAGGVAKVKSRVSYCRKYAQGVLKAMPEDVKAQIRTVAAGMPDEAPQEK